MIRKTKHVELPVQPDHRIDVEEKVYGSDDRPIKVGVIVRRPRMSHPQYGVVPTAAGKVVRIYRLPDDSRILVEFTDKRNRAHTAYAETLRRSTVKMPKFFL